MKFRYDKDYTSFLLNIDNTAFFNFYQDYCISGIYNKKFAQQRIESFRILYRVSFLIYEFEFPNNMNIHSVILIIYLKLISKNNDLYNRSRNNYPALIKKEKHMIFIVTEFYMKLGVYSHVRNLLLIKFLFNFEIVVFVLRIRYDSERII
jgi:hypothetical protein